jgi:hypothetical protein
MENFISKDKYIPPQFYSVDGVSEIIFALENTQEQMFSEKFPGELLFATRKEKEVFIDQRLMEKLEMSAESAFMKGLTSQEDYNETIERIKRLRSKYKI